MVSESLPPAVEQEERADTDYVRFLKVFWRARGAVALLLISTLVSIGSGCVLGVVSVCLCCVVLCLFVG